MGGAASGPAQSSLSKGKAHHESRGRSCLHPAAEHRERPGLETGRSKPSVESPVGGSDSAVRTLSEPAASLEARLWAGRGGAEPLVVMVTAASVQDRDGGRGILNVSTVRSPRCATCPRRAATKDSWSRSRRAPGGPSLTSSASQRARLASRYCSPLGGRAHVLLADALQTPRPRLRAPTPGRRSDGQVGNGRHHAQPPRTATRPLAVVIQTEARMTISNIF
jgi:hypothetical protein